jgi:hypothetical protein
VFYMPAGATFGVVSNRFVAGIFFVDIGYN